MAKPVEVPLLGKDFVCLELFNLMDPCLNNGAVKENGVETRPLAVGAMVLMFSSSAGVLLGKGVIFLGERLPLTTSALTILALVV